MRSYWLQLLNFRTGKTETRVIIHVCACERNVLFNDTINR